jgi:hypothetical protein
VNGAAEDRPNHVAYILLQIVLKLLGEGYDLGAVKELRGRQMGLALAVGGALEYVEKGIRDTMFVGKSHLNLLAL